MNSGESRSAKWLNLLQAYQGLTGLLLLLGVAWFYEPKFFDPSNFANVLNQVAIPGLMAIGMTFIILTGGIDLSVGSLIGFLNCVAATWCKSGASLGMTAAYVMFLGILVGATIGSIINLTKLQPFVVTLAAMVSLRGIAYTYSNNANVSGVGKTLEPLQATPLGLPIAAWILLLVTAIAAIILATTRYGRHVYAIGGNEEASRLSGVPVSSTRVAAYAMNGLCVAIAALLFTARTNNGQPSAGMGYELDAIAAVVVGGSSLLGGYGNALGTVVGALFIACINVLLILKGVNQYVGMGWKGGIILVAVYLQNIGRR